MLFSAVRHAVSSVETEHGHDCFGNQVRHDHWKQGNTDSNAKCDAEEHVKLSAEASSDQLLNHLERVQGEGESANREGQVWVDVGFLSGLTNLVGLGISDRIDVDLDSDLTIALHFASILVLTNHWDPEGLLVLVELNVIWPVSDLGSILECLLLLKISFVVVLGHNHGSDGDLRVKNEWLQIN